MLCTIFLLRCTTYESTSDTAQDSTLFSYQDIDENKSVVTWIAKNTTIKGINGIVPIDSGKFILYNDTLRSIRLSIDINKYFISNTTRDSVKYQNLMDSLINNFSLSPDMSVNVELSNLLPSDSASMSMLPEMFNEHFFLKQANYLATCEVTVRQNTLEILVPFHHQTSTSETILKSFVPLYLDDAVYGTGKPSQMTPYLELGLHLEAENQ